MAIVQITGDKKTQRNFFAFLVAVEKYDQEHINNLYGCLNDLNGVEQFLINYCKKIDCLNFQPHKLENEQATRRAIIEGFNFFSNAQDGDVCLFYFSGHGSRIDAPKEFRNESDKMLEAIVCYQENGNDNLLIDKELSFLIEEITANKDIHFVAITDSCHSGSNTKNTSFNVRSCSDNLNTRNVDDYWGRSKYNEFKNDKGELTLSAPVGKHYKLSACTKKQLSKEKALDSDGEIRGVFTYALLRTLKECGTRLTYSNLMNKTRLLVQALINDQSPQLEVIKLYVIQRDSLFLNGALIGEKPTFLTHYDDNTKEWKVDIGSSYGVKVGDIIILKDNNLKKIKIKDVKPIFSILYPDELTFTDRKKKHDCTILFTANRKLNLTFSDDSDFNIKQIVSDIFIEKNSNLLSLNAKNGIDYVIHAYQNSLTLTYPDDTKPVFCRIKRQNKSDIRLFINLIEKVAEWHRIVLINNEQSTIDESELDIKLSRVIKPYIHSNPDSADSIPFDNWKEDNIFRYFFDDNHPKGVWHAPAFRLSITSKRR